MHALMAAILLRMSGFDSFDANAQAQPPHGEFAQAEQSMRRSEGHAIITANVGGQAALLKEPLKHGKGVIFAGRRKRFTSEQKTAGVIGDGQRITVLAIAKQKLAFVIGTPELIRALPKDRGCPGRAS